MLSSAMMYLSFYLLMPLLPLYLTDYHHADKHTIGTVLAGFSLAALLARPLSGYITDNFDRKKVMLLFIALFGSIYISYLFACSLLAFAIIRTVHGAPYGAMTVANSTMAIDVVPSSRRGEGIGYYGLSTNVGMALGPSLGLILYQWTRDFDMLFCAAGALAVLGFLFANGIKPQKRACAKNAAPTPDSAPHPSKRKMPFSLDRFFLTRAWLLAINIALFGFCFGALSNYIAIFTRERYGIEQGTGTFFVLLATGLICARLLGSRGLRDGHVTRNAGMGVLVALLGYVLFAGVSNQWVYYVSALLIGFGNGHMYPAFLTMFVDLARNNERGTANSTILTGWDVGFGLGVLAVGIIAQRFGMPTAFATVAAVEATGVALFFAKAKSFYLRHKL